MLPLLELRGDTGLVNEDGTTVVGDEETCVEGLSARSLDREIFSGRLWLDSVGKACWSVADEIHPTKVKANGVVRVSLMQTGDHLAEKRNYAEQGYDEAYMHT